MKQLLTQPPWKTLDSKVVIKLAASAGSLAGCASSQLHLITTLKFDFLYIDVHTTGPKLDLNPWTPQFPPNWHAWFIFGQA